MLENCKTNNLTQNESATVVYRSVSQLPGHCGQKPPDVLTLPIISHVGASVCVCVCVCVCVLCVCVRTFADALRIVSTDKILCFINTSVISSSSSNATSVDLTKV